MAWQPPPMQSYGNVYNDYGGMQRPMSSPIDGAFYNSDLIRTGFSAYGERILGSSKDYVQSNVSRFMAVHDLHYYFQVNEQYVRNKLKVIMCPFLHKGHWTRIAEQVAGGLRYKAPRYDINAPDLYIPFMAFATYVVTRCYAIGMMGKFKADVMRSSMMMGAMAWFAEVVLVKCMLWAIGSGDVAMLDVMAYGGYAMVGLSMCIMTSMAWTYLYYGVMMWMSAAMGSFLVKTLKRILFAEVRNFDRDSSRYHYLLLFVAIVQFPIFLWFTYFT